MAQKGHSSMAGEMACNICRHRPLDEDGSCGKCGADPETAWTPPLGYEAPITKDEVNDRVNRQRNTLSQEEIWELRRKFRLSRLTITAFAKEQKMARDRCANALRGRRNYEGF